MAIKILSTNTINKISAGEVIERPASVVKELVENAVDAGATKIQIILEQAGKNLITITDDGCGMSKEELELAIQRHATSKLDEDDLLNINSFGFRGEALPSIGAISKFKIISKKTRVNKAYTLAIIGVKIHPAEIANCNEGTTITVRDLFFATPARLKFLRSDRTELNACTNIVKKIALSHPKISFTLIHNDKELLKVRAETNLDSEENLKNRIQNIICKEFIDNSTYVFWQNDDIEIFGFTSLPTYNRAASDDQFLFINNRPVKDKVLNIALKVAYQDFLARDRYPIAVLYLKIDPILIDVNVHPAKTEVRFHDPNSIRSVVIKAIKDALNNTNYRVADSAAKKALDYMNNNLAESNANQTANFSSSKSFNDNLSQETFQMPTNDTNVLAEQVSTTLNEKTSNDLTSKLVRPDYALAAETTLPSKEIAEKPTFLEDKKLIDTKPNAEIIADNADIIIETRKEESKADDYPLGAAKAQLHQTYIISQTADSIIITDQHAAHERLGYEKIKQQIDKDGLMKQRLLIPEIVELPDERRAELIEENKEHLSKLGLTVAKFGEKSVIFSETPSLVGEINAEKLINDIADNLLNLGENIALTELIEHVTETYACHYAIRAGRTLNGLEMNTLLRQMEETPFSGQCNHGRPTYVELKLKDIEKLFGRR
ncbi:MAG: DNA mismatch repair endonuclease MutL [Rickettsiaceae bacterium]|nr:DNA mismatch repair endonuclease MutL [Rickettsiaceae bacterium]